MHCKPNPLENGKRSGQLLNSTRCRCDARHQHWKTWTDTNHNLNHSLIFTTKIGVHIHYSDQIWTHKNTKSDSYTFYTCMRDQHHLNLFVNFLSYSRFSCCVLVWKAEEPMSCLHLTHSIKCKQKKKEHRRLTDYSGAGNCHEMNPYNRSLNKNLTWDSWVPDCF